MIEISVREGVLRADEENRVSVLIRNTDAHRCRNIHLRLEIPPDLILTRGSESIDIVELDPHRQTERILHLYPKRAGTFTIRGRNGSFRHGPTHSRQDLQFAHDLTVLDAPRVSQADDARAAAGHAQTSNAGRVERNRIFISYRREDAPSWATQLHAALVDAGHPRDRVFRDVDTIPGGQRWRQVVHKHLAEAAVVAVLIGPTWLRSADDAGRRRLDQAGDVLRWEVETALRASPAVLTVPILCDGADLPRRDHLPPGLRDLVELQTRRLGGSSDLPPLATYLVDAARGRT